MLRGTTNFILQSMIATTESQEKGSCNFIKSSRNQQTNMLECGNESEEITMASYKVSHLLARSMKSYSDGKVMKRAAVMFAKKCRFPGFQIKAKKLQCNNDTVTQRVEWIFNDQHELLLH